MSEACLKHCQKAMNIPATVWTVASIIENIFVFRCKEVTELLSCVMILKEFLKSHPQVDFYSFYQFIQAIGHYFEGETDRYR